MAARKSGSDAYNNGKILFLILKLSVSTKHHCALSFELKNLCLVGALIAIIRFLESSDLTEFKPFSFSYLF